MTTVRLLLPVLFFLGLVLVVRPVRADDAPPRRILVAVSHSQGLLDEAPLKHAKNDAARVRDVFVQMGRVRAGDAIVLDDPDVATLVATLARVRGMTASTPDAQIFFYFSGHGDRERLHLGQETYAMTDLSARLAEVPAQLRVVVTDACRTQNARNKGGTVEPGFAITLSAPAEAVGSVWLYASAEGEAAQESDELSGAIFTHHWLNGLSGAADVNGDRRVTLEEAYAYAHAQTMVRSFRGTGTLQRPSAKFDVNMHAPITVTEIPTDRATLRLPQARDIYYLVSSMGPGNATRSVASEVWSSADRSTELSLPPGKYAVQRRAHGELGYLEVDLGRKDLRSLSPDDFRAMPREAMARKGGDADPQPDVVHDEQPRLQRNSASIGYLLEGMSQLPFAQGIHADYMHSFGPTADWTLTVGGGLVFGKRSTASNDEAVRTLAASALFGRSVRLGSAFALRGSIGPELRFATQDLTARDSARLAPAGIATSSSATTLAPGGLLALDAEYVIVPHFLARVRGEAGVSALTVADSTKAAFHAGGVVGLGVQF